MEQQEKDALRFAVLGPVRAWQGDRELDLGPPQQRAVLVALLLRGGRAVTVGELIDAVWGEDPPLAAVSVLRTYASRLRKVLEAGRRAGEPPRVLVSVAGAYALRVADDCLDLRVRERRVAEAKQARAEGDLVRAGLLLRAALEGWENVALTGIPGPLAEAERSRLAEIRLGVLETRLEADLELGRHDELVAELTALVAEYPLHERLWHLLMLALYHCGRQAEALAAFSDARRTLVRELGVEPGRRLQELHARVLAADQAPAVAPGPAVPYSGPLLRPEQLPTVVADFVGREEEVRLLRQALTAPQEAQAAAITVIVGMGGVGKTALAVQAAHVVREHFPDGQLYADLRGADRSPADALAVLAGFLRALGAQEGSLPGDPDERAALYRSQLASRRILVVLDNVYDTDQVRPLLPGSSSCGVLVTSRSRLAALPATRRISLEGFAPETALALFARIVGEDRVRAEPDAALRVVEACGGLPLAVRVVASRLGARPGWSMADLAERLSDEQQRLTQLRVESLAVESSFRLGYAQLTLEEARVFRLLALHGIRDIGLHVAAAAVGMPMRIAEEVLERLVDVGMLESSTAERYRYHDLLRLFARQQAEHEEREGQELDTALTRLLELFLATARTAYQLVRPGHTAPQSLPPTTVRGQPLADAWAARAWADRELPGILAVVAQAAAREQAALTALAAAVLWALDPLLEERFGWQDAIPACRAVVQAARRAGNKRAEGRARYSLGGALAQLGQWAEADEHTHIALSLADATDDKVTLAMTLNLSGVSAAYQGDGAAGIDYFERAVAVSVSIGDQSLESEALGNLNQARLDRGHCDVALLPATRRHLSLTEEIGDPLLRSRSLYRLGQVQRRVGHLSEAIDTHRQGLELIEPSGPDYLRAGHLFRLAEALRDAGRPQAAIKEAEHAAVLLRDLDFASLEARIVRFVGDVLNDLGHTDRARACWIRASAMFTRLGLPTGDLDRLIADSSQALGEPGAPAP